MSDCQTLGIILENKVFQNLKLSKNNSIEKCAPKLSLLNEKKIRTIWMILEIESSL